MNRIKLIITLSVILILLMGFSGITYPAEQTGRGSDILRDCGLALEMTQEDYIQSVLNNKKPMPTHLQQIRANQCQSYVVGFKDSLYVSKIYQEENGIASFICLPENSVNNGQAIQIVLNYLRINPQLLGSPQAAVVFNAFYYAFPCKK